MPVRTVRGQHMPGIVAGGHELRVDAVGVLKQLAEFQPLITDNARIGSAAAHVFVDEVVDDPAEIRLQIQRIERDIQPIRDAPRVGRIVGAAAALLVTRAGFECRQIGIDEQAPDCAHRRHEFPVPHEDPDHFMPRLQQQMGRHTAVDPTGHGQHHSRHRRSECPHR